MAGQSIPFSFVGHVSKMASLRMQDDSFEEGDSVGVFALAGSSSLEEERYFDNECFVRSSGSLFTAADPLFYPDSETPLDIISYYPYSPQGIAPGESALAVSVQADQGIAGNYPKSDFLVAEKTGQHASMEPVDLEYRHKFFRLNIVLSPNGGVTAEELLDADPQVSVHGFYTKAAYDFSDSTYVGYQDEAVVSPAGAWSVEDGELSGKHAILIPQETTVGYQYIMLEVKGKRYKCWLPDELELGEGKQCRLRIAFEAEEDVLLGSLSGEISSWVDGEDMQATSDPLRKYISIASLDFTQSCVFKVLDECPECHAVGVRVNRQSGLCRRCTEAAHVAEEEAFNQLLEAEAAGCDGGPEYEELHRRWAQLRQKNSRLMRKHGLKGKRERL